MELKGSKTEKCLMEAFAGESQARNKYTYFASKAKKEGYVQIAEIFTETAENAVAVHIRHLREKLEFDPAEPRYIKVIWGQGYRFENVQKRGNEK